MANKYEQIELLEKEIAALPVGYISKKNIGGKVRYYRQWLENKKIKSQYIKDGEYEAVKEAIARRKELSEELDRLKKELPREQIIHPVYDDYNTNVMQGEALIRACAKYAKYQKRDCFSGIEKYLNGDYFGRVCVVYGLRRTGKTTMLYQAIADLPINETVYIKARVGEDMGMLNQDLKKLVSRGYKYIFLDEITLLDDFIDSAALLSDIYAMQGIKIVMSGTDSLGFWFAEHNELYDRAIMIHTTFIPFREHARLLDIHDIDEYIRYGGTFIVGEEDLDDPAFKVKDISFKDDESTRRYIDTAICQNIQHSLACCERGGHFRHLYDLYEAGELTNAINRIIEDENHRFLLSVLTKDFSSGDLGTTRSNLRKATNPEMKSDILDKVNIAEVTKRLMDTLDIRNKSQLTIELTTAHINEIKEYLRALDLIVDCPTRTVSAKEPYEHVLITQPGMRYCQATALVRALMKDPVFNECNERERNMIKKRILNQVKGRMLEDIILLECTKTAGRNQEVFKLQFGRGEYDMVVYDSEECVCSLFEVKHSDKCVPDQYKNLVDEELYTQTERYLGDIARRAVIYRGENTVTDEGIEYINVEEFLEDLPDSMMLDEGQGFSMKM